MPFKKGFDPNRNNAGRPKGAHNETTTMVKEVFASLLEGHAEELSAALEEVRQKSPQDFLKFWIEISTRFVPQVSRREITGADGEEFKPINIVLPKKDE